LFSLSETHAENYIMTDNSIFTYRSGKHVLVAMLPLLLVLNITASAQSTEVGDFKDPRWQVVGIGYGDFAYKMKSDSLTGVV